MTEEKKVPEGAVYTLVVPLDRDNSNQATYHIKDITEDVFLGAKSMMEKGKTFDAVRMIIKELRVDGDSVDLLKNNMVAMISASKLVEQLIDPVEGKLKKN